MAATDDPEVRELERVGPVWAVFGSVAYAAVVVGGPVALIAILQKFGHRWIAVTVGVVVMLVLMWWGLLGLLDHWQRHRLSRRLLADGVPTTAEVLWVGPIVPRGETSDATVAVRLRVAGPGGRSFDVECVRPAATLPLAGETISVLVDPTGTMFTIPS